MNQVCNLCNIKIDENNYLEKRTVCKSCYTKTRRKNNNNNNLIHDRKPKTDYNNDNNSRTHLFGPSFSGKTYFMLKLLPRIPLDRDFYIFTKSPPEQYSNSKIKIKEISDEIKTLNEYENAIVVLDDISGSSNSRHLYHFLVRGRHNNLGIHYLSESYFDLPKRTIRNNSKTIVLFNQTLWDIENI